MSSSLCHSRVLSCGLGFFSVSRLYLPERGTQCCCPGQNKSKTRPADAKSKCTLSRNLWGFKLFELSWPLNSRIQYLPLPSSPTLGLRKQFHSLIPYSIHLTEAEKPLWSEFLVSSGRGIRGRCLPGCAIAQGVFTIVSDLESLTVMGRFALCL